MDEREAILAELQGARERAAALLRAKMEAVASQIRDAAARTIGELDVVLPPDLEAMFPLGGIPERLAALTQPVQVAGTLALEGLRRLDAGRQQSVVLQELLNQLAPWCGPRSILVFREGVAQGWAGDGHGATDPSKGWRTAIADSPALRLVAEGQVVTLTASADPVLEGWIGDGERKVLVVPMSLRGKVVGGLLATEGEQGMAAETVQLLVYLAGLMMETLSVRTQAPTPSLIDAVAVEKAAVPVAVIEEPESPFGVVETPAAPEPAPEMAPMAAVSAVIAPPSPEPVPEPVRVSVPEPEPEPEVANPSITTQLPVSVPPPVAVRAPEDDRRHEEARRFARLLVSEIRLYNEQAVVEGKANRDIYQRLKEDIDRSREMYEQRISPEIRAQSNYFFEELVRILGDGDPDALGL
ncbi:MAG: hypothetical protein ACOY3Y_04015 [Acidobacteriota bacterium]